jgi:monofunctional glycosyltransferase
MSTRTTVAQKPRVSKQKIRSSRWSVKRILLAFILLFVGYVGVEYLMLPSCADLKSTNPTSSALIDARIRAAEKEGNKLNRQQTWVPIERISRNMIRAVLGGEDSHFFAHNGFDAEQIQKALEKDWAEMRFVRGASTITQQLAKNLYLSESKNPLRKLKEAVITTRLEKQLGKRRILEIYLNVIEWGDGIYGVEAAARNYLGKSAAQLSIDDAAYLAAMIPNPRTVYNPKKNPNRVARRKRVILRHMKVITLPRDWR